MSLPAIASLEIGPQEIENIDNTQTVHRTLLWDFDAGEFVLKDGKTIDIENIEYLKVWIKKALLTIKNTLIYEETEYGSAHYSLIGTNFKPGFIDEELKRLIREALLQNSAITNVSNFKFSQEKAKLKVEFDVTSIYGVANGEVRV